MPILVICIVISLAFYIFYKIKFVRSNLPIEKRWISAKSSMALGLFVTLFGLNQLFLFQTTITYIIAAIFIIMGGLSIGGDTGRFLFPSTTEKTFMYAGELIHYHFSRTELFDQMYELDSHVVKLNGYIMQNFEVRPSGAASMVLSKAVLEEFGVVPSEASLLVGTLGNVKGIKAWVFFIEEEDQIRVRLRSKGPIINGIARNYNGGGHPLAAGASIYHWDEANKVLKEIDDACQS